MTNKEINLATVNAAKIADRSMPLARVIATLETLGFVITERANRSPSATVVCPLWFAKPTEHSVKYYKATNYVGVWDIRDLALDALVCWDKYVNADIVSTPITPEIQNADIEPEDIHPTEDAQTEPEPTEDATERSILITPYSDSSRATLALLEDAQKTAEANPNTSIKIRSGYYFYFSSAYNALLEIERIDYSDFSHSREWICRYSVSNEGIAYRSTLTEHLDELRDAANSDAQTRAINAQIETEPTEDKNATLSTPTDARITIQIVSVDGGINGKPTAKILSSGDSRVVSGSVIESHMLRGWSIDSIVECRASVFVIMGVVSVEIMQLLNTPLIAPSALSSGSGTFSPMLPDAITATVKVINVTGKFEVIESSSIADIPVGKQGNSTVIVKKDLGSVWLITCHLTDKGSIKIDSITEPTEPTSSVAPIASSVAPSAASVASVASSVPTVNTPEPLSTVKSAPYIKPLTANVAEWACADYYISPDARQVLDVCYKLLQKNPYQSGKVLITGESGYGKTTILERFAEFVGFDCYRMNCAAIRDTEEWFFDREVKTVITNGVPSPETVFTPSEFSQRIARGNCVIILDEFNRLESNLHNSLFPLLDDAGKTTLHHIEFTVGPNVIFVATVNLGAKFVGTFLLDDALTNRFDMNLEVKPMPFDHECAILRAKHGITDEDAESIVRMAALLRENEFTCPTRDTLRIAKMCSVGLAIRHCFEIAVIRRIPEDETSGPLRKSLCDLVNKHLGDRGAEFAAFLS